MNIKIYDNTNDLITALAQAVCDVAKEAIATRGQFNFVLSGGSSPRKLYKLLASEPNKNQIDWENTCFFFGDERFVPKGNSQRNSLMAKKALFDPLKIKNSHIFKVDTTGSPEEAAQKYAESIAAHFQKTPVEFDFLLLGIGENAHTASLFPNTDVLDETEATIKSVFVKEVDMYRITMTAPLINQAKNIGFLVFGKDKSEAVFQILEDKSGSVVQYPARLINSDDHKVVWYLDTAAASRL
ncbi:6-phosphogluconolactonase [Gelidibacter salicanalis]|uniref:6-phosphogluconolactonase n=1 Tax=Gelidibacter salicanalis TaxID=291193 RepID=A0A934NJP9_9FLAO|nr:6-phosphogluconolactonase [Gelidibacter salicanalis]MBJ7881729.1 6-phosphogluconolactonase [Gelidibacter salicanalis]